MIYLFSKAEEYCLLWKNGMAFSVHSSLEFFLISQPLLWQLPWSTGTRLFVLFKLGFACCSPCQLQREKLLGHQASSLPGLPAMDTTESAHSNFLGVTLPIITGSSGLYSYSELHIFFCSTSPSKPYPMNRLLSSPSPYLYCTCLHRKFLRPTSEAGQ